MLYHPQSALTVPELLSTRLSDGTRVTGTLWLHPLRRGRFEIEYRGKRKSDGHTEYTNVGYVRCLGRILLRELAENGF